MKITKRQLRRIIKEEYQKLYEAGEWGSGFTERSKTSLKSAKYPTRSTIQPNAHGKLVDMARYFLGIRGGLKHEDEAKEDFYDWGENAGYDLYDLRKAWDVVIEEFEAAEEAANPPSVPEWQTQEWHDATVEDWEDDSLESLRQAERDFEDSVRRDERRGGYHAGEESRRILQIIRDLIKQKGG